MSLLFSRGAACASGPQVPELCAAQFTLTLRINATNAKYSPAHLARCGWWIADFICDVRLIAGVRAACCFPPEPAYVGGRPGRGIASAPLKPTSSARSAKRRSR